MNKEQRADRELKFGQYQEFNAIHELIADLHRVGIILCPQCGLVFYPESAGGLHCSANL